MKGHTVRLLLAGLVAGIALACSGTGPTMQAPVPDEDVSLRREGLQELTQSMAPQYPARDPGGNARLERAYYGAPPMVPHVVELGSVTAGGNDCLDCHEVSDEETPGIPPSHRVKALFQVVSRAQARGGMTTVFERFAKAKVVAGNRYDCMLCHVPQSSNAAPLVGNTFQPSEPADAHEDDLRPLATVGDY